MPMAAATARRERREGELLRAGAKGGGAKRRRYRTAGMPKGEDARRREERAYKRRESTQLSESAEGSVDQGADHPRDHDTAIGKRKEVLCWDFAQAIGAAEPT